MSGVRVLVGTHKGAFVMTSDAKRKEWDISGPHFTGWDVYHVKGSPVDPNRIYAAQNTGWFGQIIQRSDDGGKTWNPVGNKFAYEGATGQHLWYDGTPRPWEFKRVWHLEPSLTDPDLVYAGVEDAALFRSTDGGQNWEELPALRQHETAPKWAPGAGGMCLHTILLDKNHPDRIFIAISSAGVFKSEDAGKTWRPANKGLHSEGIPDPNAEVGHCVHRIAMNPSRPDRRRRVVARSQRQFAERLRVSDRCASARAEHDLCRAHQERLGARAAGRKAPRLPQPYRRQRLASPDQRIAPEQLLRQRAS